MRLTSFCWRFGVLVIMAVALPATSLAEPIYLPLSVGDAWSYDADPGTGETMTVVGTRELLDATVHVIDYSESTHNDSLENYWTREADGDVLLWGFFREEGGGWGYAYVPPIRWIDVPVFVGKTWTCTSQVYQLPSEVPLATPLVATVVVTWEGDLSVPAGTFSSIALSDAIMAHPDIGRSGFALDGRASSLRSDTEYWYSDSVGEVQYNLDALYQLSSYGVAPVETVTWARIKVLYR